MNLDHFMYTVMRADATEMYAFKTLSNIEVSVYKIDLETGNRELIGDSNIYDSEEVELANPFTTDDSGDIDFFVEYGEWEVDLVDQEDPQRITDKTLVFHARPNGPGTLPSADIQSNGELKLGTLAPEFLNELQPVGTVIDWWRPQGSSTQPPEGWRIADGSKVRPEDHDYPHLAGQELALPDLRNKFILGANPARPDGIAAVDNSDLPSDAPGIRGTFTTAGPSTNVKNLRHTHAVPNQAAFDTSLNGTRTYFRGNQLSDWAGQHTHGIQGDSPAIMPDGIHRHYHHYYIIENSPNVAIIHPDHWHMSVLNQVSEKDVKERGLKYLATLPGNNTQRAATVGFDSISSSGPQGQLQDPRAPNVSLDPSPYGYLSAITAGPLYQFPTGQPAGQHTHTVLNSHNHGGFVSDNGNHQHWLTDHDHDVPAHSHQFPAHSHPDIDSGDLYTELRPRFYGMLKLVKVKR